MVEGLEIPGELVEQSYAGPFLALRGGLDFGSARVPYFAASLRAHEAAMQIHLPGDLPVSSDHPIRLRELFQRDLNQDHVRGIVEYIKSEHRPRFFNSITVALLPLREGSGGIAADYTDVSPAIGAPAVPGYDPTDIGPVRVYSRVGANSHGYLAWSTGRTFPVVLDGQHRLRALRHALNGDPFPGRAELANARISVLFLILDPEVGYVNRESLTVLDACREIFTDLNMHAMPVARARNLLLAERNLPALCLRRLLEEEVLGHSTGSLRERALASMRLPLALIDWRADGAKFDGPTPQVTTTLALQAVIDGLLDTRLPDATDYETLLQPYERLARRLMPSEQADRLVEIWTTRLAGAEESQIPFELTRAELRILADAFHGRFAHIVLPVLVRFAPYAKLIQAVEDSNPLNGAYEAYINLDATGKARLLEERGQSDPGPQIEQACAAVKMGNLAFQVVFQRAMVQAIHALTAAQAPFAVHAGFPEAAEDEGGAFVNAAVDLYNARLAPILAGGLDIDGALLGAGVTAVGRVDFRKTRVPVIAGFFVYLALLPGDWWHTAPADAELRSWLESAWSHIGPGPRQGLPGLFSRHGSQWRKGLSDVALARQLANDEDVLLNLAMERIRAALSAS